MKILVVQDYLRSGGTERQSVLLANAFAAAGHPTTLLTFRPGGALASTVAPGVARRSLQRRDWQLDWFAPGLARTLHTAAPDIVLGMGRMANCYGEMMGNVVAHRAPRGAVIATMRTGKKLPWLFRRSLRAAHHIVANSRDARDTLLREHGLPAEKISVIYNSLVFPAAPPGESHPMGDFLGRGAGLRARHGATAATTVLLCVAMFRPEKNQRELVAIAAGLPAEGDWQLWLAGDGPARAACERLVAERQLAARVKFLGFHRDPAPLYAAADVAVHASGSEALSNFLIEAQAHGLAVVAYEAQGIAECFLPDRTGWVIPRGDREAFRAQLVRLMTEPRDARDARSAAARAFARETFDPHRQVAEYLKLFARLQ